MRKTQGDVRRHVSYGLVLLAVAAGVAAAPESRSRVDFVYTDDWQPGDQVSFTVRGKVVAKTTEDRRANEEQGVFSGKVVLMKDSLGKETRLPWSPLLQYVVPSAAGYITATLAEPDGRPVDSVRIPVHSPGAPLPIPGAGRTQDRLIASPISQVGKQYRVYSPVGELSGNALAARLVTQEASGASVLETTAVAASPHSAIFEPAGTKTGPHMFTMKEEGRLEAAFPVSVCSVTLDTSRLYNVKQKGSLSVEVTSFPDKREDLRKLLAYEPVVTIINQTPEILAFQKEPNQITWKIRESHVKSGRARRDVAVQALLTGDFQISAVVSTPRYLTPATTVPKVAATPPCASTDGKGRRYALTVQPASKERPYTQAKLELDGKTALEAREFFFGLEHVVVSQIFVPERDAGIELCGVPDLKQPGTLRLFADSYSGARVGTRLFDQVIHPLDKDFSTSLRDAMTPLMNKPDVVRVARHVESLHLDAKALESIISCATPASVSSAQRTALVGMLSGSPVHIAPLIGPRIFPSFWTELASWAAALAAELLAPPVGGAVVGLIDLVAHHLPPPSSRPDPAWERWKEAQKAGKAPRPAWIDQGDYEENVITGQKLWK